MPTGAHARRARKGEGFAPMDRGPYRSGREPPLLWKLERGLAGLAVLNGHIDTLAASLTKRSARALTF